MAKFCGLEQLGDGSHQRIDIDSTRLTVAVNGNRGAHADQTQVAAAAGHIGLFVDIGCESFFADLKVTPNGAECWLLPHHHGSADGVSVSVRD